jgi:uncharacterized protein (TIGR02145 family)
MKKLTTLLRWLKPTAINHHIITLSHYLIIFAFCFLPSAKLSAQVTIGAEIEPKPFSVLEIYSQMESGNYGGLRLPRLTTDQRNALSAAYKTDPEFKGLMIYNTDNDCMEYWNGKKWISQCGSSDPDPDPVPDPETYDEGVIINGVKWATRNLAAHGKFVENPEDYGALFQWGRVGDGHEQRTSQNYPTNDNTEESGAVSGDENFDANGQIINTHAAYGKFIKQSFSPFDWRSPQIGTLWNSGSETAPVKTANDPCPTGWRVPTQPELASLGGGAWESNWNGTSVNGRVFGSTSPFLFLPAVGYRNYSSGALYYQGSRGYYWSSTQSNATLAYSLLFYSSSVNASYDFNKASGFSIRCVAEP